MHFPKNKRKEERERESINTELYKLGKWEK